MYCRNRYYNQRLKKTPFECAFDTLPDLRHMHVLGCAAYVQNERGITALTPRANLMINLGVSLNSKEYVLLNPANSTIVSSRNVHFVETSMPL